MRPHHLGWTVTYPGGKNGAGVYQRIINLMPPHRVYIEPFLGGAAIMRLKRPAALNFGIDRSQQAINLASNAVFGERIPSPKAKEGQAPYFSPVMNLGNV
jgi:hypothetical protein